MENHTIDKKCVKTGQMTVDFSGWGETVIKVYTSIKVHT